MPKVTVAPGVAACGPQIDLARSVLQRIAEIVSCDVQIQGRDGSNVLCTVGGRDNAAAFQQLQQKVRASPSGSIRGIMPLTARVHADSGNPVLGWLGMTTYFRGIVFIGAHAGCCAYVFNAAPPAGSIIVSGTPDKGGSVLEWSLGNSDSTQIPRLCEFHYGAG